MITQKIKNSVVSITISAALFGGLVWLSRSTPSANTQTGQIGQENTKSVNIGTLSADEPSFDFGTVSMARGKVSHLFKIKNSSEPAIISKIYTSCMCTNATLIHGDSSANSEQAKKFGPFGMPGHGLIPKINDAVNADEEIGVEVVFDPAAHGPAGVGKIERVVFVETESGLPLQLKFSVTVTP